MGSLSCQLFLELAIRFLLLQIQTAIINLNEAGLQSYMSDRKSPASVLAILEKAPPASNWGANFDARIEEGGPCLLFCRAYDVGVSPNNISKSANALMKACKGGSTTEPAALWNWTWTALLRTLAKNKLGSLGPSLGSHLVGCTMCPCNPTSLLP